ncbi:CAP-Gly domain-containing linker protein 2 [Holothuria leucospilota]|uniref:CAP-Gly domain-containing linker protein 2 n=1 Tax=Holothuria leucospilota TaxID=206669 RepID=A0A9Q0YC55_HOLLE|nr:CAP-Gly domain-containing linker protein 2 [Holothuria leucospilota]
MTRKSEWTGMSPGSSDSARGSSFDHWDSQDFSSSLKGDRLQVDESIVEDKETASSAVAFVVHSSRKGIIHLCADVANLIKAKKRLQLLVNQLQEENARLKQSRHHGGMSSEHTSRSTTPSPHSLESLGSRYRNSSHRGRRKGSAARQSCLPPSPSTSTLTSPGEELVPSYEEKPGYFSRRYRRQLSSSKRRDLQEFEQQALCNTEQQTGSLCRSIEERCVSGGAIHTTDTSSNQHRITVEIHPSPLVKEEEDNAKEETAKNVSNVSMDSVAVQCSMCEDLHQQLQENIEHVTREKSRIQEDYLQVQEEVKQLKLQIQRLEDDKQMKQYCAVEFENETGSKDKTTFSKCISSERDSPYQLPHLSANSKTKPRSLNKTTSGFTIHLEDRVMVKGDRTGTVRYIGPLKHLNPTLVFVGVHLDSAAGRHDGYIHGYRYFECPKDHGVFIPVKDVQTVLMSKSIKRPKTAKSSLSASGVQVLAQSKKTVSVPAPPISPESPPSCPSSSQRIYVRRQSKSKSIIGRYSTEKQLN